LIAFASNPGLASDSRPFASRKRVPAYCSQMRQVGIVIERSKD
jgi:hypothetical protein